MPVPKKLVFIAKLICVSVMIFISELWIAALFVLSGKLIGLTAALPAGELAVWCLFGTLGGAVMAAIQLMISLFLRGFALPVAASLGGGLSGLFFLAKKLGHIWPYSLMAYGMNSNAPQELLKSGYVPFVLTCAGYIALFTFIGGAVMRRRDM